MSIQTIPLNKLGRSEHNVRTIATDAGIAELAASIERDDLLQNLTVIKAAPGHAYTHEVVAGGRRLAALKLLAKQGKITGSYPVPCRVVDEFAAEAVSLAENQLREQMHPLDQLNAFVARVEAGEEVAEVASRFGVTEAFVRQRIKLASVAPSLLDAYREGQMTLEQLQAFTVTDDRMRQLEVWQEIKDDDYNNEPSDIRRALLGTTVDADDYRLKFVGVKAYQKAGGAILKPDLFADAAEQRGVVSDPVLLDTLVADKLEKKAAKLKKDEGLAFVEVRIGTGFRLWREPDFCNAQEVMLDGTPEQRAELAKLEAEMERISKEQEEALDNDDDETNVRLAEDLIPLEERRDAIVDSLLEVHPDEREHVGAFVCLTQYGKVEVTRNIIRKENRAKVKAATAQAGGSEAGGEEQPAPKSAHSEKLVARLTANKTAIMRDSIMPHVDTGELALAVIVFHMLCEDMSADTFAHAGPLTMTTRHPHPAQHDSDLEYSRAWTRADKCENELLDPIRAMLAEVDGLTADRVKALWAYLAPLPVSHLMKLLAVCVANRVDVTVGGKYATPPSQFLEPIFLNNGMIATHYWQPTRANYLDHVSKPQIIAAVTEACGADAAAELASMKRDAAATRAEELLAGTGWLPAPLRVGGAA